MGVQNLWDLLGPAGKNVQLECLARKRVAVDTSIWLIKYAKGLRDKQGNLVANSHLKGLFLRICKLLYYGAKPVFIFDGATPVLKRNTVSRRKRANELTIANHERAARKLLLQQLAQKQQLNNSDSLSERREDKRPEEDDQLMGGFIPEEEDEEKKKKKKQKDDKEKRRKRQLHNEDDDGNAKSEEGASKLTTASIVEVGSDDENSGPSLSARYLEEEGEEGGLEEKEGRRARAMSLGLFISEEFGGEGEGEDLMEKIDEDVFMNLPSEVQEEIIKEARRRRRLSRRRRMIHKPANPNDFSNMQLEQLMQRSRFKKNNSNNQGSPSSTTVQNGRITSEVGKQYLLIRNDPIPSPSSTQILNPSSTPPSTSSPFSSSSTRTGLSSLTLRTSQSLSSFTTDPPSSSKVQDLTKESEEFTFGGFILSDDEEDAPGIEAKRRLTFSPSPPRSHEDMNEVLLLSDSEGEGEGEEEEERLVDRRRLRKDKKEENSSPNSVREKSPQGDDSLLPTSDAPSPLIPAQQHAKTNVKKMAAVAAMFTAVTEEASTDNCLQITFDPNNISSDDLFDESMFERQSDDVSGVGGREGKCRDEEEDWSAWGLVDEQHKPSSFFQSKPSHNITGFGQEKSTTTRSSIPMTIPPKGSLEDPIDIGEEIDQALHEHQEKYEKEDEESSKDVDSQSQSSLPDSQTSITLLDEFDSPASPMISKTALDETTEVSTPSSSFSSSGFSAPSSSTLQHSSPRDLSAVNAAARRRMRRKELLSTPSLTHQPRRALEEVGAELDLQAATLSAIAVQQEQRIGSMSGELVEECQQLLRLFGVPFVQAPFEAEAQCAFLEMVGLVDAVITDDSDAFLFGAECVYRNMFDQDKYVECYYSRDVLEKLGLDRRRLIDYALLVGSDYTHGVRGIGMVTAVDILKDFETLELFRDWYYSPPSEGEVEGSSRAHLRRRLQTAKVELRVDFPAPEVIKAYEHPDVDQSLEAFEWGCADLDELRKLSVEKFGWHSEYADRYLLPVVKSANQNVARDEQTTLDAWIYHQPQVSSYQSKRLADSVQQLAQRVNPSSSTSLWSGPSTAPKKRKQQQDTTANSGEKKRQSSKQKKTLSSEERSTKNQNDKQKRAKK